MKHIKIAWKVFFEKENFIYFVKISLPILALSLLQLISFRDGSSMIDLENVNYFILIPFIAVGTIVGMWFQAANLESVIRAMDGGKLEFKDTYKKAWSYTLRLFAISMVAGLIIGGGIILLLIPGIIFAVWYAFPQFAVATKYAGVRAALKESKSLSQGRFWKTLGQLGLFILFSVVGQIIFSIIPYGWGSVVATIFGALFLLPYYLLYQELSNSQELSFGNS